MHRGAQGASLLPLLDAIVRARDDFELGRLGDTLLTHALAVGLGPLAADVSRQDRTGLPSSRIADVQGAALTGRILSGMMMDALEAILDRANGIGCVPLLLKGAACAQHYYSRPELRTMGDLDLLVPEAQLAQMEEVLRGLGYLQDEGRPGEFYVGHHHGRPFRHPIQGVWVELHTRLLERGQPLSEASLFDARAVRDGGRAAVFRDRRCLVMAAEVELAYLCARWVEQFDAERGIWPLLDAALLMLARRDSLDWQALIGMAQREPFLATAMHVALGYLARSGLAAPPERMLHALAANDRVTSCISRAILWGLVDDYYLGGRQFGPLATEFNVSLVWTGLLVPRPAYRNVLSLPLRLAFPPGQAARKSAERIRRGLASLARRRHG